MTVILATKLSSLSVDLTFGMLGIAMLLAFLRLARGPTLPDRVIALDLMGTITVGWIAVYAIASGERTLLSVAMVLALISFLGTVAFAYYVEKGGPE